MAARLCGCHPIIVSDVKASRLELAEELGASHTTDPDGIDPVEAIRTITGGGAEFAVETTGLPAATGQAVACLAENAECALAGAAWTEAQVSLNLFQLRQGRILRGSFLGNSLPAIFIPRLIELYRLGSFPVDRIISEYRFADINKAADDILSGAAVKAVLIMP
jgi:aryl-alcohol dehydrogenase